ncbi:MAG TPA: malto-oligosyltrehalose synthase [Bryobacteraceae bacterium]|nr:malto-oligosyltrehalose synthase [Bryobacteraceae bacterium]
MKRRKTQPERNPCATYRLQFNRSFTFEQATGLVEYLEELGITDVYASPFLMARPGSLHGYDVTDHTRFNPEIGDEESFLKLSGELHKRNMGLIADVVPNHMCISHPSNLWWWDVLENGPSSPFARFFDIEWHPPKAELVNKVLLPVLGDQYGRVLENKEIQVIYSDGQFQVAFYETPLPLAPRTWTLILEPAVAKLRDQLDPAHEQVAELESIITALSHLPDNTETDDAKIRERQREKDIVKRRLSALVEASPQAAAAIDSALVDINGERGNPRSFDRLERLLESEAYRLSYWRVAMDEINYRRFFDINDLAAIRVEDPEVFSAVHALLFDLVRQGHITGLRIDHPDGLFEPEKYFRYLQDACKAHTAPSHSTGANPNGANRTFYIVAEKILVGNEALRTNWAIEGTTGYSFLNLLNGVFVDRSKEKAFQQLYRRFTGWSKPIDDLVCESKRLILQVAMSSELNVLARKLDRISEQHRWYRDFTLENLRDALREVITTFPVYRTYIQSDQKEVDTDDRKQVLIAIREAKRRNPAVSESVFDFIRSVLLLEHPEGLDDAQRAERQLFALRFQQLTAPVMAKGVEDTAFYRYYPLASLTEVGGGPERFGVSVSAFHRRNLIREELWPNTMNATATHDTKRGEDVRARINVLSEMPGEWYRAIRRWREMNRQWKTRVNGALSPGSNEEYLFYQTLVGTWPLLPMNKVDHGAYTQRIQQYMEKALHEAKVHTSWINPNVEYDQAVREFVANSLAPSPENAFLEDFCQFQAPVASAGIWNALSQALLKITAPGVPDFYQGAELWSLELVDPDNRGPVDYEVRRNMLVKLRTQAASDPAKLLERLASNPCDGAIKLYITSRALQYRKMHRELFAQGSYVSLTAAGNRANNVIAFARSLDGHAVIALAGRFFLKLRNSHPRPVGDVWGNTSVVLPPEMAGERWHDVFTGQTIAVEQRDDRAVIPLAQAFSHCPVALLASSSGADV